MAQFSSLFFVSSPLSLDFFSRQIKRERERWPILPPDKERFENSVFFRPKRMNQTMTVGPEIHVERENREKERDGGGARVRQAAV